MANIAVPDSKGSPSCSGHVMPEDIDSGSWVDHRACLDVVAKKKKIPFLAGNKPFFQCETTCQLRCQSKLQGTK